MISLLSLTLNTNTFMFCINSLTPFELTDDSAIGQYGFQVTPIQAVRAVAAMANDGTMLTPTFVKGDATGAISRISLDPSYFQIVHDGMRLCVTMGTCTALNVPYLDVAAKTGTAQLGVSKDLVNSWTIGFWPADKPRYAFAVVMERASKTNQFGAALVIRAFLDALPKSNILLQ